MSQHLQKKIKKDVRKWSEEFLEIPNKHLGGFPACPFAKKTWNDNKVIIEVKRKSYKKDYYRQKCQLQINKIWSWNDS